MELMINSYLNFLWTFGSQMFEYLSALLRHYELYDFYDIQPSIISTVSIFHFLNPETICF
jgi:hypothetical protein